MSLPPNEHQVLPNRRLGRREDNRGKPRLQLRSFLTGTPLPASPAADHFSKVRDWGLHRNDEFGVCGPTMVANSRRLVTEYLTGTEQRPTDEDVFDLYRRSGNPGFDPNKSWSDPTQEDNGVYLQDLLSQTVKGGIGGQRALAFAEVDHTDLDELYAAIDIFGFLCIGVDLHEPQQGQTDRRLWEYVQGGAEWGGHAVLGGRYANPDGTAYDRTAVVTWAEVVDMTPTFIDQQLSEAWVLIWPEHLRDNAFREGVDLRAFAVAYTTITGRPFPVEVPPPAPAPIPTFTDSVQLNLSGEVASRVRRSASRARMDVDTWAAHHFGSYFKV